LRWRRGHRARNHCAGRHRTAARSYALAGTTRSARHSDNAHADTVVVAESERMRQHAVPCRAAPSRGECEQICQSDPSFLAA
jgi:hypothetical protein